MVHLVTHVEENERMSVDLLKYQLVVNERILITLLKNKFEAFGKFRELKAMVETQSGKHITVLISNGGFPSREKTLN